MGTLENTTNSATQRARARALLAPSTAGQLTAALQDASNADETEVEVVQTQTFEVTTVASAAQLQMAAGALCT